MRDIDVRVAMLKELELSHKDDLNTRIVEELGIWSNTVRVDIAVINGEFHGIELKSARDNLERLPNQSYVYNKVFDKVTLVVAEKHKAKASSVIPDWWGIIAASSDESGSICLSTERIPAENPCVDALQVARLFWKTEAITLLNSRGLARGHKSKTAEQISSVLVECFDLTSLRTEARKVLKDRNRLGKFVAHMGDVSV